MKWRKMLVSPEDRVELIAAAKRENILYRDQIYLAESVRNFPSHIPDKELLSPKRDTSWSQTVSGPKSHLSWTNLIKTSGFPPIFSIFLIKLSLLKRSSRCHLPD